MDRPELGLPGRRADPAGGGGAQEGRALPLQQGTLAAKPGGSTLGGSAFSLEFTSQEATSSHTLPDPKSG